SAEAIAALRAGRVPKGDALAVARIAGIQGAKRTPDLVPLCHPIALHSVTVDLEVRDDAVVITAETRTADRTGVEMEALTSVAVAALALIDMVKAVDPAAVISDVRVEEKTGGKTGFWGGARTRPGRGGPGGQGRRAGRRRLAGRWRRGRSGRWRSRCRTGPRLASMRTSRGRCWWSCCAASAARWTARWSCGTESRWRRRCARPSPRVTTWW